MSERTDNTPRIMVVDDTPSNLHLLESMLRGQGYRVFALPNGEMALKAAALERPDLILLDILMPGLDGYEVCSRLKATPALREIPVIFLSALSESWDKVRAFKLGGVDYITKPFQLEEVEARVRTHIALDRQRRELQASYERLRQLEGLRDNMVHMLVHDLRSPLAVIRLTLDLAATAVSETDHTLVEMINAAKQSATALTEMISQLLDISRFEAGQMPVKPTTGDLVALVRAVCESMGSPTERKRVLLNNNEPLLAFFDPDLTRRVLVNLLGNALKFTPSGGQVNIHAARADGHVRLSVADNGPGIPPEMHQKIFEKFGQVDGTQRRYGTGLGLTFCKLAVEAHGGKIGVISEVGQGSTFWFTLPPSPLAGDKDASGKAV